MPEFTAHQHLTFWRGRLRNPRFVYVIGTRRKAPIKIGVAKEPEARLRELQTGNPNKLRLLYVVPGGRSLECELHRRLEESRLTGEWFSAGPETALVFELVVGHAARLAALQRLCLCLYSEGLYVRVAAVR